MTTIAFKDGVVAYDSRATKGDLIISDNYDKHTKDGDAHFFFCGATADESFLIAAYFGEKVERPDQMGVSALIYDGNLWEASFCPETGFWKAPVNLKEPRTLGSGGPYALTAMDMGATAKEAVKMAMKRDTGTGGRIRTYKINHKPSKGQIT